MNTSEFKIMFVDECGDETCYFYDEKKNQYYDSTYFGDYTEGDVVRVSWRCFDGINREVSSVKNMRLKLPTTRRFDTMQSVMNDQYTYEEEAKLASDRDMFDSTCLSCCSDDDFYDIDLNSEEKENEE